jgi:integrase
VKNAHGELLQPLFDKFEDAKAFEQKTAEDVRRGEYIDPDVGKTLLRTYATEWLAAQTFSKSSYESIERRLRLHVLPALGHHDLASLERRPSVIQAWVKGLSTRLAASSTRLVLFDLATILNAAVEDNAMRRNPCHSKSVKAPTVTRKRVRPWTAPQVEKLRAAITDRFVATVDVGWGLGLRQGEMFGLAEEDVDWLRFWVHVRRQVKTVGNTLVLGLPKYDQVRDVPLSEPVSLRLAAHLKQWPARDVTLPWEEPDGPPVTVRLLIPPMWRQQFNRDHWKPALKRVGIPATRAHGFHHLRHTFASSLLAAGVDIRTVAEFLGHKDPGFTLRVYEHLMPGADERVRKAVAAALTEDHPAQLGHSSERNDSHTQRNRTNPFPQVSGD